MARFVPHRRWSIVSSVVIALLISMSFAGIAMAAPPTGDFLNPHAQTPDGPGPIISDKPDGTDDRYHFVLRLNDAEGLGTITSVEIQIEDGDADTDFEPIGSATRVGETDTWQLLWDMSAHTPRTDVDDDDGFVRAEVSDGSSPPVFVGSPGGQAVDFQDENAETLEITSPANGGTLGFFDGPDTDTNPESLITGTASAGVTNGEQIELYYSTQPGVSPTWVKCEDTATVSGNTWTGRCELQAGATVGNVSAIAARVDAAGAANSPDEDGDASGDAHRVSGYAQTATGATVAITPEAHTESVGFCDTYTVTIRDNQNAPIVGANVDVHATGPDDTLQFALNREDADPDADGVSDAFNAPTMGPHTSITEAAAGCDTDPAEPNSTPPRETAGADASDDNDSNAPAGIVQSEHDNPAPGADDQKHIEGHTDANGFQFSIDSESAGTTDIQAWFDANDDDTDNAPTATETSDTATQTWVTASIDTITASPDTDTNPKGSAHTVTVTIVDQNGNPKSGEVVRFRVMAGPHADNPLDPTPGAPGGYFGQCTTNGNGQCSRSYTGTEEGTDTITVWVNVAPETGADAAFTPDADDRKDDAEKIWRALTVEIDLLPDPTSPNENADPTPNDTERGTANSEACDAAQTPAAAFGGATWEDADTDPVNGVHLLCVGVQNSDGAVQNGRSVVLTSSGVGGVTINTTGASAGPSATAPVTDGYARFYIVSTGVGTQTLTATVEGEDTDGATKTWTVAASEARIIDCTSSSSSSETNTNQTVTCTVTDGLGNPVPGASVTWTKTDNGGATSVFVGSPTTTTNVSGQATATVTSSASGSTTVTGSLSPASSECEEAALQPHAATNRPPNQGAAGGGSWDTSKSGGLCSDSSTTSWTVPPQPPPPSPPAVQTCPRFEADGRNQIVGTAGKDTLVGTPGDDIICGGGGNDVINGGGGNDLILGDAGRDRVRGEDGNDVLFGGDGNDALRGGAGDDTAVGQGGNDVLSGNAGNDLLKGSGKNDTLKGGAGNDGLGGGGGRDVCREGAGNDAVQSCEA